MGSAVFAAVAALVFAGITQFPDRAVDASSLPPLPPGTELLTPADLGLSQGDLDKFLGKVKVLAGREGGGSKTQILAVGFDENEKLNLENFQELSTDGLDGRDKGVVAEALKGFRKQYGNNKEQDSSGSESEEYSQIVQLNAGQQGQPINPHLAAVEAVRDKQHAEQFKIAQQQQEQQNQQQQVQEQHFQLNQQQQQAQEQQFRLNQQQQNAQQQHFQPTEQQQLEQQQIQDDAEQQRALIEEQLRIQLQIQAQEQQQNLVQPQIQQIPSQQHVQVEQQQIQDQQQQQIQNQPQQIQDQQQIHEQQQQILGDVQQQGPVMFVLQPQAPQAQVDAGLPVGIQATHIPYLAQQEDVQQQYIQQQQTQIQQAYLQQQYVQQEQLPIQPQPQPPIQQQFVQFQQQPTQQEYAQEQRPIQQEYVQFQQPIQQEYVQFRQPIQQEFVQQQPPTQQQEFAQQQPPTQQQEFVQQQPPVQQPEFTQQQHVSYKQPSTAPAVITGPAYQTYDQPTRGSYIRPQPSEVIQSSIRPSYDQTPSQDISEHSFRLKQRPNPIPVPLPAQHMEAPVAKEAQPNWSRYPGYRSPAIPVAKPDQLYKEYVTYHNVHSPVQNEAIDLKSKPDNGGLFGKYATTFRDAVKSYSPNSVNSESPVKSAFGSDSDRYRYRNLASTLSFGSAYRTTDSREQYRDSDSSYYPPSQAPNRWFDSASSNRYRPAQPEVMHPTPRPYTGAFEVTPSTPLIRISNPENAMPPRGRTARSGGLDIIAAASSNVHSAYLRGPSHYDRTKARVDLWYRRR